MLNYIYMEIFIPGKMMWKVQKSKEISKFAIFHFVDQTTAQPTVLTKVTVILAWSVMFLTPTVRATMEDEVVLECEYGIMLRLSHTLNTTIISIKCHVFYQELNLDCQKSQCAMYCSCHTLCAILTALKSWRNSRTHI